MLLVCLPSLPPVSRLPSSDRSIGSAKETGEMEESLKSNSGGIRLEEVERIPRVTTVRDSEHI